MLDRILRASAIALVGLGALLRMVRLEADPDYYGWWGWIFDEGRWLEQARHVVLFGDLPDRLGHNAGVAPLFEAGSAAALWLGGPSLWAGRLVPALCGTALVVVVAAWLWRRCSPAATLLGVAMVALPADLVVLSRIAAPEMPALLGTTGVFMLLVDRPPTPRRMLLVGVLAAAVLGLKVTTFFVMVIFGGVALALREPGSGWRARGRDAAGFLAGLVAPILLGLPIAWWLARALGVDPLERLGVFTRFFGLREAYALVALPYLSIDSPVVVPSCLGLWLAGLAWYGAADRGGDEMRWLRAFSLWAGLFLVVCMLQLYFPERYRVHVLVPLAILTAHAVTRLERDGLGGLAARVGTARPVVRVVVAAWVVGVAAVQIAALIDPAAAWLGLDPDRLSTRVAVTLATWAAATAAFARFVDRPRALALCIGFSVASTVLQLSRWVLAPYDVTFFVLHAADVPARLAWLALASIAAIVLTVPAARRRLPSGAPTAAVAASLVLVWSAHVAPGILAPRYTLRDASLEVGRLLEGESDVHQNRAESLFIGNGLAYAPLRVPEYREAPPRAVVVELPLMGDDGFLHARYEVVRTFELYVPPDHSLPPPRSGVCTGSGQCFAVLRRIDAMAGP